MDRLDTLVLFTRIVETGSFSRAAEMLDIPRPTATNAIKDLEARLGVRLLDRTTRQVRATHDGQAYYDRCVHVLSELDDAEASFRHVASNPRGTLRVDMSGTHAQHIVLPAIDDFRRRYPNIELVLSSGDRLVDLVREGVDCVIRAGALRDSNLVARPLASMPQVMCASPDYLARCGTPRHPDDLAGHQMVKFFASGGGIDYPLTLIVDGAPKDFMLPGWISVNDAENNVLCALRGAGIVQVPRFHVEQALADGRLVALLPEWRSPEMTVSALYPYRRHLSPRVRVFVDWLVALYGSRFGPL
ncbi:DNA-binding transcriptional LysR family regulator [Duganella sp. 1224]|uniref:LysR family transcriptional regulator n=1 Tax=Duganella sp. 1224 TaxID=2587052 RepID=UPI0015CAE0D8|nr:LysR family transcriptional regulator [Duganella sp. 1224]NYE59423.1 DNA-binding transcriptional LysR family regulator [Duganella sp. 1224]